VVGPPLNPDPTAGPVVGRIWWQSLNHVVQYVVPEDAANRKVLPTLFRAPALPGLIPAWPRSPLPTAKEVQTKLAPRDDTPTNPSQGAPSASWQPVLPGGHVVVVAGARPGAPFAFREFLQTQAFVSDTRTASITNGSTTVTLATTSSLAPGMDVSSDGIPTGTTIAAVVDSTTIMLSKHATRTNGAANLTFSVLRSVVSGSVPVMHRTPRPVLLPPNVPARPDIALQTWAGAFHVATTVNVLPVHTGVCPGRAWLRR
jgi:hypothetical protein